MEEAAKQLVGRIVDIVINPIILVIFAAGFFMFMYGLVEFLWSMRQGEIDNKGKQHMLWGTVGMLIMVSVYGIIILISNTFNLGVTPAGGNKVQYNIDHGRLPAAPFNFTSQ